MDRKQLSELDICTKFITPALRQAGWDEMSQLREEVTFTKGRIILRGKLATRGKAKRADYILYYKPNIPLAVIEAKDNHCSVGDGIQQALEYAETLRLPFVFSSNGDGFVFHDRSVTSGPIEKNLRLDQFPRPADLWKRYREWQGLPPEAEPIVLQDYYTDGATDTPIFPPGRLDLCELGGRSPTRLLTERTRHRRTLMLACLSSRSRTSVAVDSTFRERNSYRTRNTQRSTNDVIPGAAIS